MDSISKWLKYNHWFFNKQDGLNLLEISHLRYSLVIVGAIVGVVGSIVGVVGAAVVEGCMVVGGAGVVVTGWKQALICNLVLTGFVPLVFLGTILISTFEA